MRQIVLGVLGAALLGVLAGPAMAQGNPRGKTTIELNRTAVPIEYGRPSLHGRTIQQLLGQLKPGGFWRLGADQSTTFETTGPVHFGKVTISKGTYSLWARKETGNKWTLVFNKQHGQWGSMHNATLDFASVPLEEEKSSNSAEMVTLTLRQEGQGGELTIEWGDLRLSADLAVK